MWSAQANKAVENIFTCATEYYSKSQMKRLSTSIKRVEGILKNSPKVGAVETLLEGRAFEYRHYVLSWPFKLIYTILDDVVWIVDVWDTRRSPENLVKNIN